MSAMTMEETIEVTELRKRFWRTVALDGMSFTVRPGLGVLALWTAAALLAGGLLLRFRDA
jgi:hypothetical protein